MSLEARTTAPKPEPTSGWLVYRCGKCNVLEQRIASTDVNRDRWKKRECHGCANDSYPSGVIEDPDAKKFVRKVVHDYDQ